MNRKKPYIDFEEWHLEKLKDPEESNRYLQVALEDYEQDHDVDAFLLALHDVIKAHLLATPTDRS